MKRDDFVNHVELTLKEVLNVAQKHSLELLPQKLALRWMAEPNRIIKENIEEAITNKVYLGPDKIYPYVSIGVCEILSNRSTLIHAAIAQHKPRPFGRNIKGHLGPFDITLYSPFYETSEE